MDITKEEFESYEEVRESGMTNMFAVDVVNSLSGLSKEKIRFIMINYDELSEKHKVE